MFRAHSAHHQEVNEANCTYATVLCNRKEVVAQDSRICTICVVDLLMMGGVRSKNVEEFNLK